MSLSGGGDFCWRLGMSFKRHRWEDRGTDAGVGVEMGCPLPRKFFDFWAQEGEFLVHFAVELNGNCQLVRPLSGMHWLVKHGACPPHPTLPAIAATTQSQTSSPVWYTARELPVSTVTQPWAHDSSHGLTKDCRSDVASTIFGLTVPRYRYSEPSSGGPIQRLVISFRKVAHFRCLFFAINRYTLNTTIWHHRTNRGL